MFTRTASAAGAVSPLALFLLVNALNIVDAGLTILWIDLGVAVEGNPVVNTIGFPAKIVGVAAGSAFVSMVKPQWLWLPIAALAFICFYHVTAGPLALLLK